MVGSQTGSSTPGPSFGHNLCFRCPNEQCEPILRIYASRAFQWYKERHKTLRFDPCNRSLKFRESTGTSSPKVGVALGVWVFIPSHSLTLSYTPRSMWCDSRASSWLNSRTSSWPATLQPLCLGREPKARVATSTFLQSFTILAAFPRWGGQVVWKSVAIEQSRWSTHKGLNDDLLRTKSAL